MINIIVLDDHPIILSGVKIRLKENYPDSVIDCVQTGTMVIELIKTKTYDLVILDINVPGTDTNLLVKSLLSYQPNVKILIFSAHPENIFAKSYLKLGVKGYLCKDASKEEFTKAVNTILKGKSYISENLSYELSMNSLSGNNTKENPFEKLSEKELTVCMHLLKGLGTKDICNVMKLQPTTVSTYKGRIFEKLDVSNTIELRKLADLYNIDSAM